MATSTKTATSKTGTEARAKGNFMAALQRAGEQKSAAQSSGDTESQGGENDDEHQQANGGGVIDALADGENRIAGDSKKTGDGDKGKAGDGAKPKTVEALAETLGISVEDVYAIELSLADGDKAERLTLGKVKDLAAKARDLDTREVEFAESRAKQENELLRSRTELREILAALPAGSLSKEMIAKVKERQETYSTAERSRLLEVIGEWQDDGREATDRAAIKAHLEKGYAIEGAFLDRIVDHRVIKFIYDAWRRYEAVTKALNNAKEVRSKAHEPSSRTANGERPRGQSAPNLPSRPLATHELRNVFTNIGNRG